MADDEARARRTTKAAGAAKKATPKKASPKQAATPPAAKAAARKAAPAAKKAAPARKAAAAPKAPAKRSGAAPPKKAAPAARDRGAILAPGPRKAPSFRVAAEETMEDDWQPPAPQTPREDPHARIRSLLRDAARQVEGRAPVPAPAPRPAPPAPPPARPAPPPEPDEVTRVLVAPAPPEEDEEEWLAEEDFEDEVEVDAEEAEDWETEPEADDEEDWSPPEILEEDGGMRTIVSAPASRLSSSAPPPPPPPRTDTAPPPPPPAPSPATEFTPPPFQVRPAPDSKGGRSRLRTLVLVLLGVVVVAGLLAGGLWAYNKFVDEGIDYSELKVGDCFDSSASNEIRGIKVKPCAEKHNSEIFFIVTHPAGPSDAYPGKDTLVQYAADNCLGQPLTDYLGIPLEQSKLKDFEIVPQESAWKDGRRALVCGLDTGGEGDITGSVKGTRR